MADQITKLLSEAERWIQKKEYEQAAKLIQQALNLDGKHKKANKMQMDLYALLLDKNMWDNVEGYERVIKKELGEGWKEIEDLWQEYRDHKISYIELTDKAFRRDYVNITFRAVSEAMRKAQLVFIEGEKE